MIRRHTYPDPSKAAEACAHHVQNLLEEAISGGLQATFAVSGGSTPRLLFQELAKAKFPWDKVHLFWVDERAVPPTDSQSNYRLADESFIEPAHFPRRNVHRIQAELRPDVAAQRYAEDIRAFFGLGPGDLPHFDIVHRGMGPDAHTASLFPGEPMIEDRDGLVAAVYAARFSQWRITMLPGVLLAASHTVMLVAGADKANAVRDVFHEPYDPKRFPAQISSQTGRRVTWFLDEAAASLMD